jgi:hypothetical protein
MSNTVKLKDFDHKVVAKHFKIEVGSMLKLKKSGSPKWVIHVKAYLYDMSKI